MNSPSFRSRVPSWNSFDGALTAIASEARKITGPSRAQKREVLGGSSGTNMLEALLHRWSSEKCGNNVIVMVGAGISVSAGFPDFRDKESGVYARIQRQHGMFRPEDIFTHDHYERKPEFLCSWLQEFLAVRDSTLPTTTHLFLKLLEQKGRLLRCYTQNIDGLELAAGLPREKVVMVHGEMSKPACVVCNAKHALLPFENKLRAGQIPKCEKCGAPVRPDIVFFGEATHIPSNFQRDFDECDLLIILGTSLNVNPFANLVTRVPVLTPRLLLNRDKVLIKSCRHQSRQLNFSSRTAYRDVWLGGHCDESVQHVASYLGWSSELLQLEADFRGGCNLTLPTSVPDSPHQLPASEHIFGDMTKSSTSEPSLSSSRDHSLDCVSVLSDDGCINEVCQESPASCVAPSHGLPNIWSRGSIASMISELSAGDLDLVDQDTGTVLSI